MFSKVGLQYFKIYLNFFSFFVALFYICLLICSLFFLSFFSFIVAVENLKQQPIVYFEMINLRSHECYQLYFRLSYIHFTSRSKIGVRWVPLGPILHSNLSLWLVWNKVPKLLIVLLLKSYSVNTLGCIVLKFWPNIFLIKACYQVLGQVCKFVLRRKKFYRIGPRSQSYKTILA